MGAGARYVLPDRHRIREGIVCIHDALLHLADFRADLDPLTYGQFRHPVELTGLSSPVAPRMLPRAGADTRVLCDSTIGYSTPWNNFFYVIALIGFRVHCDER